MVFDDRATRNDKGTRLSSKEEPKSCPVCGAPVATLLGGLPKMTPELEKKIEEKKVILMGCDFYGDVPSWQCTKCGVSIYKDSV